MLATTGEDGFARVWNTDDGRLLYERRGKGAASEPSFAPDSSMLAASWRWVVAGENWARTVRVMDPVRGQTVRTVGRLRDAIRAALGPGGSELAILSVNRDLNRNVGRIWSLDGGGPPIVRFRAPLWFGTAALHWNPDGRSLLGIDGAFLWNAQTGERIGRLEGHGDVELAADLSADGSMAVTASADGTVGVWELREQARLFSFAAEGATAYHDVAFSPDGGSVVATDRDGVARIWDVGPQGGREWAVLRTRAGTDVGILADGRAFSVGRRSLLVTDPATGRAVPFGPTHESPPIPGIWSPSFDISPDGSTIAVDDDGLEVRDVATGRLTMPERAAVGRGWSPTGTVLALDPDVGPLEVHDLDDGHVSILPGMDSADVAFSPDGRLLAAVGWRTSVECGEPLLQIWDWRAERLLADRATCGYEVGWTAGGEVVTFLGPEVRVWDGSDATPVRRFPPLPAEDAGPIAMSGDGTKLAVATGSVIRLLDPATGEDRLSLEGHGCPVTGLDVSDDGSTLISHACDGIRVWALDIDDLLDLAAAELTRGWTEPECRRYLHQDGCPR